MRVRNAIAITIGLGLGALPGPGAAQENHLRVMPQPNVAAGLREQPVSQAEIQSLKAQVSSLQAQVSAMQAVLADTQKAAGDAHFMGSTAIKWIEKNGNPAQQAGQWIAAYGGPAQQAAQWVSSNGAAVQQMVGSYPTHTHVYHYLGTNWTNRKFVTNSHLNGDDTAYGSYVSGNSEVSGTTGPPK